MIPDLDQISEDKINELLEAKMEYERLDYKVDLEINSKASVLSIAKDMAAMANSGGGHIVIGIDKNFVKIGIDPSIRLDEAVLRDKVNFYFEPKIDFLYKEPIRLVDRKKRKFLIIYVKEPEDIILPRIDGNYQDNYGKQKMEFRHGDILIRNGSESKIAGLYEIRRLLERLQVKNATRAVTSAQLIKRITEASKPDDINETLLTNLLPVKSIPQVIWEAITRFSNKTEALHFLAMTGRKENFPSFIIREDRLISFSDLSDLTNPLRVLIEIESSFSSKISLWRKESVRWRRIVELMNLALKDHCKKIDLVFDEEHKRYYFPAITSKEKKVAWKSVKRRVERKVVSYYDKYNSFLHRAARMKFLTLGEQIYLLIDPRIIFTSDGINPTSNERLQRLSTRLTYMQYNYTVLTDVRFWSAKLANAEDEIRIKGLGYSLIIDTAPADCRMTVGYDESTKTLPLEQTPQEEEEEDLIAVSDEAEELDEEAPQHEQDVSMNDWEVEE